jgi:pilus assembly protein Flp/PilA
MCVNLRALPPAEPLSPGSIFQFVAGGLHGTLEVKVKSFKSRQNIDLVPHLTQNLPSGGRAVPHHGLSRKAILKPEVDIMRKLLSSVRSFSKNEEGAALVEYAVILGIILAVTVAVMSSIGSSANTIFTSLSSMMSTAATP